MGTALKRKRTGFFRASCCRIIFLALGLMLSPSLSLFPSLQIRSPAAAGAVDDDLIDSHIDNDIDGYLEIEPKAGISGFEDAWVPVDPFNPGDLANFQPSWMGKHPDAPNWTIHARTAIRRYGSNLMRGAADVASFCPSFGELNTVNKENFWIQLIASIVRYESNYKPDARYVETTMGKDPVTGQQVVSEGLLQLSYQDEPNYRNKIPSGTCDFDYQSDRDYPNRDLRRTILNPKINLTCGVAILDYQIRRYEKIAISSGAYWAVIKTTSRYNRLSQIRQMTKSLKFCQ